MLEKMLHHKLLKEGAQGQGVVTERHDQAAESSSSTYSIRFELAQAEAERYGSH